MVCAPQRDRPEIAAIEFGQLVDVMRQAYDAIILDQQLDGYEPDADSERFAAKAAEILRSVVAESTETCVTV